MHVHTYSILSVPFYDVMQQQYIKILCINAVPVAGALAARVKTVRPPRLSGLCGITPGGNANGCIHAILTGVPGNYMTPDQLPELFAFLLTNGYTVDTALTKLAAKHQSGGGGCGNGPNGTNANSLVCLISYNS
jgi:hypothetical protein